jgi:hypothetical protein
MNELEALKDALAFSIAAIAGEHFLSAGLSSPWSVQKFSESEEDAAVVWRLFYHAAIASAVFAVIVGWMMHNGKAILYGLGGSVLVSLLYYYEYKQALAGQL